MRFCINLPETKPLITAPFASSTVAEPRLTPTTVPFISTAVSFMTCSAPEQTNLLTIDQGKTEGGDEAHLEIPLHPKLREIVEATPTVGVKTFLVTHLGKPYTAPGFGNWFRELCDAAGCHGVSAHGLRKATARRLAEIGCSANQIAAITGHATLKEVQRYTNAADRKRMAREAMAKLIEGGW
jgi:integrase